MPGNISIDSLRPDHTGGCPELIDDVVHVGDFAGGQLFFEVEVIQTGTAGHESDARFFECVQVRENRRAVHRELHAAIVEENDIRQIVELCEGEEEALDQDSAECLISRPHFVGGDSDNERPFGLSGTAFLSRFRRLPRCSLFFRIRFFNQEDKMIAALFSLDGVIPRGGESRNILYGCIVVHCDFDHAGCHRLKGFLCFDDGQRAGVTNRVYSIHRVIPFRVWPPAFRLFLRKAVRSAIVPFILSAYTRKPAGKTVRPRREGICCYVYWDACALYIAA